METTFIVSDLHLGACNSEGDALLALLQARFDRLIINGDTVDHLDFRRFRPLDWQVIARLQAIARERELIVVRGNHDGTDPESGSGGSLNLLGRLLGAEVREDYSFRVGLRRYLVLHGDQFDDTLNLTRLGQWADCCYRALQRCSRTAATWAKHRVKEWTGVVDDVRERALAQARDRGTDGIIVGHTHFSCDELVDHIHYLNTGCWVDWPCTYVAVEDGQVELRRWEQRTPGRLSQTRALVRNRLAPLMPSLERQPSAATAL